MTDRVEPDQLVDGSDVTTFTAEEMILTGANAMTLARACVEADETIPWAKAEARNRILTGLTNRQLVAIVCAATELVAAVHEIYMWEIGAMVAGSAGVDVADLPEIPTEVSLAQFDSITSDITTMNPDVI